MAETKTKNSYRYVLMIEGRCVASGTIEAVSMNYAKYGVIHLYLSENNPFHSLAFSHRYDSVSTSELQNVRFTVLLMPENAAFGEREIFDLIYTQEWRITDYSTKSQKEETNG